MRILYRYNQLFANFFFFLAEMVYFTLPGIVHMDWLSVHGMGVSVEVFTLPPFFRPDSDWTPSDFGYPDWIFFCLTTAGIFR